MLSQAARAVLVLIVLSATALFFSLDAQTQPNLSIVVLSGGGPVQTGTPGTTQFTVDFRINLSTLGDAPAGTYSFTITYTVSAL